MPRTTCGRCRTPSGARSATTSCRTTSPTRCARWRARELVAETLGEHVFDYLPAQQARGVGRVPGRGEPVRAAPLPAGALTGGPPYGKRHDLPVRPSLRSACGRAAAGHRKRPGSPGGSAWRVAASPPALTLTVLRPHAGDAIPAADDLGTDGLLVLGGDMGANDDRAGALAAGGARTAARSRGARVADSRDLPRRATARRRQRRPGGTEPCRPRDRRAAGRQAGGGRRPTRCSRPLPITPDVLQWHFDAVVSLPPGAVQLASAPACEHQAFRLGRLAWGVQFHIETTPQIVQAWARDDAAPARGLRPGPDRRSGPSHAHEDIAAAWITVRRRVRRGRPGPGRGTEGAPRR